MKITRFQTDRRLWFWIALALFVACWFIPFMDIKGWHASPFGVFLEIANDVFRGNMLFADAIDSGLIPVTVFAFASELQPSSLLGWFSALLLLSETSSEK